MSNKITWKPTLAPGSYDSYTGGLLPSGVVVHVCIKCRRVVTEATHKEVSPNGRCFGCDGETETLTTP